MKTFARQMTPDFTEWETVDCASASASSSVLPVFGRNLRLLTSMRGTQSKVARELDIGRVQFRRYLYSESFPKPHVLKKICLYFGVDSRIITEPLTEALFAEMQHAPTNNHEFPSWRQWMSALSFAAPSQDYFAPQRSLDEGLYAIWHRSFTQSNKIARSLIRVHELDGVKVLRGYEPHEPATAGVTLKQREFRGLSLRLNNGYVFLTFKTAPSDMMSMMFATPMHLSPRYSDVLVGYIAIGRDELPTAPRMSRVIIEPVGSTPAEVVRQAHTPSHFPLDEIPDAFRNLLELPV